MFDWFINWFSSPKISDSNEVQNIGNPANVVHNYHVFLDPASKKIVGLPKQWEKVINDTIPVAERHFSILAAVQTFEFLQKGPDIKDEHSSDAEENEDVLGPLPEKKKDIQVEFRNDKIRIDYKNISVQSQLNTVKTNDDALGTIRKICHHDDSKAFEQYEIEEEVGEGASGVVNIAVDKITKQKVAIKTIDLKKQINRKFKSTLNELLIHKKFQHPNVVCFIDAFFFEAPEKELKIVMEFMDGGCLTDVVENIVFTEPQIAAISHEVLKGLDYLHDHNVIHRDIKSDNILLDTKGTVKISDMGFSTNIKLNEKRNTSVGSPYWMSPEIIKRSPHDKKTDIWSYGILCIELIQGQPPYFNKSPPEAIYEILSKERPEVEGWKNLSKELQDLLNKCLVVDPDNRAASSELLHLKFFKEACKLNFLEVHIRRAREKLRASEFS